MSFWKKLLSSTIIQSKKKEHPRPKEGSIFSNPSHTLSSENGDSGGEKPSMPNRSDVKAHREPVEVLKQGVAFWNDWRESQDYRSPRPDLSEVDLAGANLCEINFQGVKLTGAFLF